MRGREIFRKYKGVLNFAGGALRVFPEGFKLKLLELSRGIGGNAGIAIRYIFLKSVAKSVGENVAIFQNVYLLNPQNLIVGNNVSIHPFSYLECGHKSGITIGNDVSIAHGVSLIATNHSYSDRNTPIRDQPITEKRITIGDNVWIGAKATIVYGRKIGNHCVIASNAVITKDVEDNMMEGGVPAKVIRPI